MQARSFCASSGEGFIFTSDDGTQYEGTCKELRSVDDHKIQFRGIVRSGDVALIDTEIFGHYDQNTDTLELIEE